MERKPVRATLLCLAAVAILALTATPAQAQDGCGCHTAAPPTNGASAAHAPLVVTVIDCTTCHKGMSPHPDPASLVTRAGGIGFNPNTGHFGGRFAGRPDGTILYLQKRLWGATEWTDLTQVTTYTFSLDKRTFDGVFDYVVVSPTPWAAYRAIAEGVAGPPVIEPAKAGYRPTPKLTLKLTNVVNGVVPPLVAPAFKGSARPLKLAGEKVNLPVDKWRTATKRWVRVRTGTAVISATGTYAWTFWWSQGFGRGSYRVRASIAATANHTLVRTTWRYFKGK